ncbi:MAG TPA: RsmD family RNA methyltransferase [Acidimicrobiia bacterium]|nr:RsmD family RNA methyltransferase [Acidimicrobiia bacterium]
MKFGTISIGLDDTVLAPRRWTTAQSRWAAQLASQAEPGPILELYCGAGHIGLDAASRAGRALVQVDADPSACRWAQRNADALGVTTHIRCTTIEESLQLDRLFPLVLADPPYLSETDQRDDGDLPHAVDGGPDGLRHILHALAAGARHLMPCAPLLLQLRGLAQAAKVEAMLAAVTPSLVMEEVRTFGPRRAIALLRRDP